jgi:hypothetical protein
MRRSEAALAASQPLRIAWSQGHGDVAIALASRLRDRGLTAATDLDAGDGAAPGVHVHIDNNGKVRWPQGATWRSGSLDEAVEALARAAQRPTLLERQGA